MTWKTAETLYFVADLDAGVKHYVDDLGFELVGKWDDVGFAQVRTPDGHPIGLMRMAAWSPDWEPGDELPVPRLSLQTDDIEGECDRLRRAGVNVEELRPGRDMRWTTFRDAEGSPFLLWDDRSGSL